MTRSCLTRVPICLHSVINKQHALGRRPSGLHISRAHTYSETDVLQKAKGSKGFIFISASD